MNTPLDFKIRGCIGQPKAFTITFFQEMCILKENALANTALDFENRERIAMGKNR